jgi:hypothetical protein
VAPFTNLERSGIAVALVVLVLTAITSAGLLPPRSLVSMAAGFVMLAASAVALLIFSWLIVRHARSGKALGRFAWLALLVAGAGAAPAVFVGVWLMVQ